MSDATTLVRPAVRRIAIVAFAILLPIAAHSLWDYLEVRRLVREIEHIRDRGEPVTEREAVGADEPGPEGERSAGDYYLAGAMLALGSQPGRVIFPIREWLAAPVPDRAALPRLEAPLQQLVAATADAVALADKATTLPFSRLTAGTDYSYRTASLADLSGVITARTLSASVLGNGDAAVDSVISGLRLRRALRGNNWLVAGGDHVDAVLSLTRPSADALRRLDAALSEEGRPEESHQDFLRDRARYIERIWRSNYGSDPTAPRQFTLPMRTMLERIWRPWFTHRMVEMLRLWADLDEVSKLPWPDKAQRGAKLLEQYRQQYPEPERIAGSYVPRTLPLELFPRAIDATPLVIDRGGRIAVAVERFRLDRKSLPASLGDLVPNYLSEIPADPYSGQPLLFKRTDIGYTIYSIGPNFKDDGGDLTSQMRAGGAAGGRTSRRVRGLDIGVRVLVRP